jgi:hypothetical protein
MQHGVEKPVEFPVERNQRVITSPKGLVYGRIVHGSRFAGIFLFFFEPVPRGQFFDIHNAPPIE